MSLQTLWHDTIRWTDIVNLTPEDADLLRQHYPQFHPLDLEDIANHRERPKLDEYDDYLFALLQFPIWDSGASVSRSSQVGLFVGEDFVVSVHEGRLKGLVNLYQRCQEEEAVRELHMGQGASRLFCTVIDVMVDHILPMLDKVNANILAIEENIFTSDTRKIVREIAWIRRDNIALRRIVRPQLEILANLEKVQRSFMSQNLDIYFGDIRDHLNKSADMIHEHNEIIAGLSDTLNTLANYRTNEVVQILTVISVILMPLTLISGIYGMNINLPIQDHPASFVIISTLMVFTGLSMLGLFRWRNWL